jgi:hypothetical protein
MHDNYVCVEAIDSGRKNKIEVKPVDCAIPSSPD